MSVALKEDDCPKDIKIKKYISIHTRGAIHFLTNNPDFVISTKNLVSALGICRNSVLRILRDLKKLNYINSCQNRNSRGIFTKGEYQFFPDPYEKCHLDRFEESNDFDKFDHSNVKKKIDEKVSKRIEKDERIKKRLRKERFRSFFRKESKFLREKIRDLENQIVR